MTAALRYECRMMLRKRSMWIALGLITLLLAGSSAAQWRDLFHDGDARRVMGSVALLLNIFLPAGYGCLIADRLVRDDRLGVAPVLDATPASPAGRLAGKYLGVCAAVVLPMALLYFGWAVPYAAVTGGWPAVGWALAGFATVLLPAVLVVGAFALAVPLLIPAPLFRVLFVGYWFWGNSITADVMPTLAQSVLTPIGAYPLALFGVEGVIAGPQPGATLNFLRPEVTTATAGLSIGLLLVLAALTLCAAHAVRARTTR
ncbi:hypothetical protein ABZS66_47420 [Dactylosporangium sp. NPDC005572]|uniref:hypothetical protein n=1 Tax=Dactylosporangium sp. NPDC005572 TaxID=3156889 RepID=UPI0033BE220B